MSLECNEDGNASKKVSSALLVPLVASLLLAGCGGDSPPSASPKPTASASPSPTVSSSPTITASPTNKSASPSATATPKTDPNIPAAARAHTPAGAEAFVRYFIDRWNVAWTVPRPGILFPLCQPSSKACSVYERSAARLAKEGHRYDGNPVTIKFIGVTDATNPNKLGVLANLLQERRSEIDKAGKVYLTDPRENFRVRFELSSTSQGWQISSIKLVK